MEKGRSSDRFVNWKTPLAVIALRVTRSAFNLQAPDVRAFRLYRKTCSLAADEAALILARFYMSPPAIPGGVAFQRRRWNQ